MPPRRKGAEDPAPSESSSDPKAGDAADQHEAGERSVSTSNSTSVDSGALTQGSEPAGDPGAVSCHADTLADTGPQRPISQNASTLADTESVPHDSPTLADTGPQRPISQNASTLADTESVPHDSPTLADTGPQRPISQSASTLADTGSVPHDAPTMADTGAVSSDAPAPAGKSTGGAVFHAEATLADSSHPGFVSHHASTMADSVSPVAVDQSARTMSDDVSAASATNVAGAVVRTGSHAGTGSMATTARPPPPSGTGPQPGGRSLLPEIGGMFAERYEIVREIGRGGMGAVYQVQQAGMDRTLALKVLLSGALAGEKERKRFQREAEASARLRHPNIIGVHDIGEWGGNLYFTMDYCQGKDLADVVKEDDPSDRTLLDMFVKICDAVETAHRRGIIHRDLKPSNVMVSTEGEPLIMDFGLAKEIEVIDESTQDSDSSSESSAKRSMLTVAGAILGSPHYMPPEQAAGEVGEIDTRSDVYSLGVILYEVMTNSLPYTGRSIREILKKICSDDVEPPSPRSRRADLPWEIEAIMLKAIERNKERRFQSARELGEDVARYLRGEPVLARPAGLGYRAWKYIKRHRAVVVPVVAVAAVVITGTAIFIGQRRAEITGAQERAGAAYAMSLVEGLEGASQASALEEARDALMALGALVGEDDSQVAFRLDDVKRRASGLAQREAERLAQEENRVEAALKLDRVRGLLEGPQPSRADLTSAAELASAAKALDPGSHEAASLLEEVNRELGKYEARVAQRLAADKALETGKQLLDGAREEASGRRRRLLDALSAFKSVQFVYNEDPDALRGIFDSRIAYARDALHSRDIGIAYEFLDPLLEEDRFEAWRPEALSLKADVAFMASRLVLSQAVDGLAVDAREARDQGALERALELFGTCLTKLEQFPEEQRDAGWTQLGEDLRAERSSLSARLFGRERRRQLDQGMQSRRAGRAGDAFKCYTLAKASRSDPDSPDAEVDPLLDDVRGELAAYELELAREAAARGDYDQARAGLERAVQHYGAAAEQVERIETLISGAQQEDEGFIFVPELVVDLGSGVVADANPVRRRVTVPAFFIAEDEVSAEAFAAFVAEGYAWQETDRAKLLAWWGDVGLSRLESGAFREAGGGGDGPLSFVDGQPVAGQERFPVSGISWFEAWAYARWFTEQQPRLTPWRLPREDEWEVAARYGREAASADIERRLEPETFPWESSRSFSQLRAALISDGRLSALEDFRADGWLSPMGCYAMAGGVEEWTQGGDDSLAVIRGGSSLFPFKEDMRSARRRIPDPAFRGPATGFRLVRSLQEAR